jgi:hypothetical protein
MPTEQSKTRLPTISMTRGQRIFRWNHRQLERTNDQGETEQYWECSYDLYPLRDVPSSPTDTQLRTLLMEKLTTEVNAYINAHYDQGSQASYQAIYILPTTPQAVKDAIIPLWPWIQSVMEYYYGKKADIRDGASPEDVNWDFTQFDATDPGVELESFMGPQ